MVLFRGPNRNMLDKICNTTEKLFMRYGIKSITMDDVAKELSMSKKTLYQFVTDKDDLVRKTLLLHIQSMDALCMNVFRSEDNAILQMLNIANMMISQHKEMNPSLLFDLKKYHSDIYLDFTEHREQTIQKQLAENLNLGIRQGLYRADININVTTGFYMALIEECLSSDIQMIANIPFAEKYAYLVKYHLNAICTKPGLDFMNENISIEKHKHLIL
jgi:AcrR family transcriptional regulator